MSASAATPVLAPALRRRPSRAALGAAGLGLALLAVALASLAIGPVAMSPGTAPRVLMSLLVPDIGAGIPAMERAIILGIRLPRLLLGVAVGAMLAIAGAVLQALFRNPLADPGLLGVSSGGALGAIAAIGLFPLIGVWLPLPQTLLVPALAFLGALLAAALIWRVAARKGRAAVATLLLAGIAIGTACGAVTGLITYLSDDAQLRSITFWTMGSLALADWSLIWPALALLGLAFAWLARLPRSLDLLLLGEREAQHLGVDVRALERRILVAVALGVGAAVALTGLIAFIGIVAPHLVRLVVGPGHRRLLPLAALTGSLILVAADLLARTVIAPVELPIGLLTSALGAPVFLALLLRRRGLA